MRVFSALLIGLVLSFMSLPAFTQTTIVYAGTFWSTPLNQGGTVNMTLVFWPGDSLSGTIDTDNYPGENVLCGAGIIDGDRVGDSLFYQYVSFDTDPGCGFDWGITVYMRGKLHNGMDSISASFSIDPTPGVEGAGFHYLTAVQLPTGLQDIAVPLLSCAPSLTYGPCTLSRADATHVGTLSVMDAGGRKVIEQAFSVGQPRIEIDLTGTSPGLYTAVLQDASGARAHCRMLLQ